MKTLVLFGLVVLLLGPGCSDGDGGWGNDGDAGAEDGDPGTDRAEDGGGGGDPGDSGADPGDAGAGDGDPGTDRAEDGGGGGEVDCRFDPAVSWHVIGEILQMESADGGTCVWLRREDLCPAGMICKTHPFNLWEIRIGHDGNMLEITDTSKLNWTGTWHNWEDVGTAEAGATTYTLTGASYGWAYSIIATGGETWGPILLEPWEP